MKNQTAHITIGGNKTFSNEEALSLILNNLDDTFLLIDSDLSIITTNEHTKQRILDLFGFMILPGMSVLEMAPPDRHQYLRELYKDVFNGNFRKSESQILKDGQTLYFEHHYKPVKDSSGHFAVLITTRNITEAKKEENILREIEERWRFALEGGKQSVWDWNIQTGEAFFSFKNLYGYGEDEMKNRIEDWESIIHPDDRIKMDNAIKEHVASADPYHETTYRIKTRDGNYKWILSRGMLVGRDAHGRPLRMIGTHTDISEQMKAEQRIKVSEQQYRTLFQSNPLPCWIYDAKTLSFLEVNNAAIAHYGYSKEEFLRSTLIDIHPQDYLEKLKERTRFEKDKKSFSLNNWQHIKKNGERIFVDLRINSIEYKDFNAKLVVAHDVTSKVQIENELRKSNERFSYAVKAASEALWEWDVVTGEVYMSAAYKDFLGWQVDNNGRFDKWHDYIHPDEREQTIKDYYDSINNPDIDLWTMEYRFLKSDGSYAIVNDKAVILRNEAGKAIKVIGATQDVTSQKKTEEELKISNDRYMHAILATSDIVWDWDIKQNKIFWSDNFTKAMGHELPSDKTFDIECCMSHIHPMDKERVSRSISEVLANSKMINWNEEFRYQKSDGSYAYVSDKAYVIRNNDNEAVRMIGAMQDITERKQNEQLLSLEKLIFEMSIDLDLSFQKLVGTLLEEFEKIQQDAHSSVLLLREDDTMEPLISLRLPDDFVQSMHGLKIGPDAGSCGTAMEKKQIVITEDISTDPLWDKYRHLAIPYGFQACWSLPIIHSSGKVMGSFAIYFKQKKSPTPYELNSLERIKNILRVLMEHNWSLNEIKVANERFDIMMKATNDLIWDWNLETNIIYRDKLGLKKVYGLDSNEPIRFVNQWMERIHPEDRLRAEEIMGYILLGTDQDTFELEYRFRKDDDSYCYVYDRGVIIRNAQGNPTRMIGAAQDVTERKRLEQELLQNELERQKAINQATVDTQEQERSEIGKELHDNVNQVLTTTKLYLDLAATNHELKDELIRKSNLNILSVINEIRQLSRSLMDPSIGDLGLIDTIHDLIENINLTRKIHVQLNADRKAEKLLDKKQKLTVFRIIQETLNNVIRHAQAKSASIHFKIMKSNMELTIEDDGIGFHPASVKKGAGLKNIQNRIYLVNGSQTIHSAPGKGCKITIKFPINK